MLTAYSACMAKILLEGRPGIGKTTVARRCVDLLTEAGTPVGGFTTSEIRVGGSRVGFQVEAIGGASAVLAHVELPGPPRIGRYGVDLAAFEHVALPTLRGDAGVVRVIDELGKMELASSQFQTQIRELFHQAERLLATVHRYRHPLTDQLKARPDVRLVRVTEQNRQTLPVELVAALLG